MAFFIVDVPPVDIGVDPVDFRLVAANTAYVRILSLNPKNVSGLRIQDGLPEGWAKATNLSLGCCVKQGESISYEASFELGGQPRTLLTTLSPVWRNDGTISQIVGVCQDVTERRRVLKEARLLQTLTLAIAESQNFHAALGVALRKICEVAGWDYGEAWVPDPDRDSLDRSPAWYGASKYRQFRRLSEELTFPLEMGLFGQVWSLHSTEWAVGRKYLLFRGVYQNLCIDIICRVRSAQSFAKCSVRYDYLRFLKTYIVKLI